MPDPHRGTGEHPNERQKVGIRLPSIQFRLPIISKKKKQTNPLLKEGRNSGESSQHGQNELAINEVPHGLQITQLRSWKGSHNIIMTNKIDNDMGDHSNDFRLSEAEIPKLDLTSEVAMDNE